MRSSLAAAAALALVVLGLTASSAQAVVYTSASTSTCKQRGYTKIVETKHVKKGSKTIADVYMTYNKNKSLEHCIVMRSRAGSLQMAVQAGAANFSDATRALYSSGASGSLAFKASKTTYQRGGVYGDDYYSASFHY